jgi:hypothetical protein
VVSVVSEVSPPDVPKASALMNRFPRADFPAPVGPTIRIAVDLEAQARLMNEMVRNKDI